jgi:hypothetical protein
MASKHLLEPIEKLFRGPLPDAHRPIALHVAMPAHRADACPRLADGAAHQVQVDDFLDGSDGVTVLRQAHGPASDDPRGSHQQHGGLADLVAGDAALLDNRRPFPVAKIGRQRVEPGGLLTDEVQVERGTGTAGFLFQNGLHQPLQERGIAVDPHLQEEIGQSGTRPQQAHDLLRILETHQSGFRQRVDGDDLAAISFRPLQRQQHPRVVRAWILPDNQDHLGSIEVVERNGPFADADGRREGGAARFVAHVGTVGQVIRAQLTHEQLIQERRLVAGAARGIEDRLVG